MVEDYRSLFRNCLPMALPAPEGGLQGESSVGPTGPGQPWQCPSILEQNLVRNGNIFLTITHFGKVLPHYLGWALGTQESCKRGICKGGKREIHKEPVQNSCFLEVGL